jgi:peptidoglycan hydrolase CwlO-like protein
VPICVAIIAFVIIVGAASQRKVQAAICTNTKAVPLPPMGVPINQNQIITNTSTSRGAPQAQIEAAQNSNPKLSSFQSDVVAGVGTDATEKVIEGLFA